MPQPLLRPIWHFPFVDENKRATLEMQQTFNRLFDLLGTLEIATGAQDEAQQTLTQIITAQQDAITALEARAGDAETRNEEQQALIEQLQADLTALEVRVTALEA